TTTRTGRKYKPLFAFLVVDLDGRVNINVHGNVLGRDPSNPAQPAHASNQGLGKHAVDLTKVFTARPARGAPPEWPQLLVGNSTVIPRTVGRYGLNGKAGTPGQSYPSPAQTGFQPSNLFALDFDGFNETAAAGPNQTTRFQPPALGSFRAFPNFS